MSALECQIEDATGAVLGAGPLQASSYSYADRLDEAGAWQATIAAVDANSALLDDDGLSVGYTPRKKIARARSPYFPDQQARDAGAGVIDRIEKSADQRLYVLGGNNLLSELTTRQVGALLLSDGAGGPMAAASILAAILTYAPAGWTSSGTPGATVYFQFNGESVFEALRKVAELTGNHFRLAHDANGAVLRQIEWLAAPDASGLRAEDGGDARAMSADSSLCLIAARGVKQVASTNELYTRFQSVWGGDTGDARLSLLYTTRNGAPGTGTATADYTAGGIKLHIEANNPAGCYIEHVAGAALYGRIEREFTATDITFKTAGTLTTVSNQLFDAAVVALNRAVSVKYDYQIELLGLQQRIRPGQTFTADYHGWIVTDTLGTKRWLSLDNKTLLLLSVDGAYDAAGVRATKVTVTDPASDYWPQTAGSILAQTVQTVRSLQRRTLQLTALQSPREPIMYNGEVLTYLGDALMIGVTA
jgi:hypothetical protein